MSSLVSADPTSAIPAPSKGFLFVKRVLDILFALLLGLGLSPILLVIAIVSAIDTKASPLFLQTRIGKDGKPFLCLKFRTMSKEAPASVATCDLETKKYISRIGRLLRRSSLDELPQVWTILKGEMSFVGPRPIIPEETELHRLRRIHGAEAVRPGLTGWAQINGRDNLRASKKAFMDGYYARHAGLKLDAMILWKTVACVLSSKDIMDGRAPVQTAEGQQQFCFRSAG